MRLKLWACRWVRCERITNAVNATFEPGSKTQNISMNTEKTEKEIKQLFSELRAEDSQRVPSFEANARGPIGCFPRRNVFSMVSIRAGNNRYRPVGRNHRINGHSPA